HLGRSPTHDGGPSMDTTKHAAILCIAAAAAAAPAAADAGVPSSLRMRDPRPARSRWSPPLLGRSVAQRPADGSPDDPPADPSPAPPAESSPIPPPSPPPGPAPQGPS